MLEVLSDQDARQCRRYKFLFREFLVHQISLHHTFAIEQQMRRILLNLMQNVPILKRVFAVRCPNMLSEKDQNKIIYYWAKRVERPSTQSGLKKETKFEKRGRMRSKLVACGTWVPPRSWDTTVDYWRYEWRRFKYLPVPNDRIKRKKLQKEKESTMVIYGSQQMVKDENNKVF